MPATVVGRRKQPPYHTQIQEEENSNNHNTREEGIVEKMKDLKKNLSIGC